MSATAKRARKRARATVRVLVCAPIPFTSLATVVARKVECAGCLRTAAFIGAGQQTRSSHGSEQEHERKKNGQRSGKSRRPGRPHESRLSQQRSVRQLSPKSLALRLSLLE